MSNIFRECFADVWVMSEAPPPCWSPWIGIKTSVLYFHFNTFLFFSLSWEVAGSLKSFEIMILNYLESITKWHLVKSDPNMFILKMKNYFLGHKINIEILDDVKSCQVEYPAHVTFILATSPLDSQFNSLKNKLDVN